ncbi:acetyl-CoA carboxylase biotin carboxyl carrier protein subunit [Salisaeta longa]|uniref:acetyl-CoA carboxylase biotin carboxyl carrier protein subunit n=1 Tax=Salisaeta longa TaxID=503170 RepID=UPI0003B49F01|nr:acetyl-CoA carboxylase biotin carboxyl carrier protein subunit [Salisaeta longa]
MPTFRATVDDQTFDLSLDDGSLTVDGEPVAYSFEQIRPGYVSLIVNGRSIPLAIAPTDTDGTLAVTIAGRRTTVAVQDERALLLEEFGLADALAAGQQEVRAPMPGLVLDLLVSEGDTVATDDGLLVLEAMKMENELHAPADGVVEAIHVAPGDAVDKNALLLEINAG